MRCRPITSIRHCPMICRNDRIFSGPAATCSSARSSDGPRSATRGTLPGPVTLATRFARCWAPPIGSASGSTAHPGRKTYVCKHSDSDRRAMVGAAPAANGTPARSLRGDVVHHRAPDSTHLRRRRARRQRGDSRPRRQFPFRHRCRYRRDRRRRRCGRPSFPALRRAGEVVVDRLRSLRRARGRRKSSAAMATRSTCGSTSACAPAPRTATARSRPRITASTSTRRCRRLRR